VMTGLPTSRLIPPRLTLPDLAGFGKGRRPSGATWGTTCGAAGGGYASALKRLAG
jgi:hypothetical protein